MPISYVKSVLTTAINVDLSGQIDNTSVIQTAWNNAATGTTLTLPTGNIRVDGVIHLSGTGKTLKGSSPNAAICYRSAINNVQIFDFPDGAANNTLQNVTAKGAGTGAPDWFGNYAQGTTNLNQKGIIFWGCSSCSVVDCTFQDCGGDGIAFSDDSFGNITPTNATILRVTSTHNGGNAMSCNRVNGLSVDTYTASRSNQCGIDFEPNGSDPNEIPQNIEVKNFSLDSRAAVLNAHGSSNTMNNINIHDGTFVSCPQFSSGGRPAFDTNNFAANHNVSSNWTLKNITVGPGMSCSSGPGAIFNIQYINKVTVSGTVVLATIVGGAGMADFLNCPGSNTVTNNTAPGYASSYRNQAGNGSFTSSGNTPGP